MLLKVGRSTSECDGILLRAFFFFFLFGFYFLNIVYCSLSVICTSLCCLGQGMMKAQATVVVSTRPVVLPLSLRLLTLVLSFIAQFDHVFLLSVHIIINIYNKNDQCLNCGFCLC